jgi:transcriptional regulator with XRE-family HTH domain
VAKRDRPSPLRSVIAKNIKLRRQALGISQDELAHLCQMHRTNVSEIERGRRNVSLDNLYFLAEALQISPSILISDQAVAD